MTRTSRPSRAFRLGILWELASSLLVVDLADGMGSGIRTSLMGSGAARVR